MNEPILPTAPTPPRVLPFLLLIVTAGALGAGVAQMPQLAFALVGLVGVVLAVRYIEALAVLMFLTLPYMAVNLPTGVFTLKLSDAPAYLFAVAALLRLALRREPLRLPPATVQVLVYAAVLCLSAAFSPTVPSPYASDLGPMDRNGPQWRSLSTVIWAGLSWMVVIALYNVVGSSPKLYRRCVCAHILGCSMACVISLLMYVVSFFGFNYLTAGHYLLVNVGGVFRLAGVAYEPMFLSFYLMTAIPVTLAVWLFRPGWLPRRLLVLTLILQAITLFLTFSSAGYLALPAALAVTWPLWRTVRVSRHVIVRGFAGMCAVGLGLGILFATQENLRALFGLTYLKVLQGGDPIRQDEIAAAVNIMQAYPILGIGPGMAGFFFPHYHPEFVSQFLGGPREITPLYFNVLAETGVIGFLALGWCAVAGVTALLRPLRRFGMVHLPILAALFASLVGCAVQYASVNAIYVIFFPALIGLATAGVRLAPDGDTGAP